VRLLTFWNSGLFSGDPDALLVDPKTPTFAVYGMTPGSRLIRSLSPIPIAPGVRAHSIIPIKGALPPQGQSDGVVEYDSAHIEPVESEIVVESPHSCQANPATMEEVRRILLHHLEVGPKPTAAKDQ